MRLRFKTLQILIVSIFCATVFAKDNPDIKIRWNSDSDKDKAVSASSAFLKLEQPGFNNISPAPSRSLAAKVAENDYKYNWRPHWRFSGTGGPWLPNVQISPDRSTLAIVETIGKDRGPKSSVIVLINLYNFKIMRCIPIDNENVRKICFIPDSTLLACATDKHYNDEYAGGDIKILIIDLKDGEIVQESSKFSSSISSLCAGKSGEKLFARNLTSDQIYVFKPDMIDAAPQTMKSSFKGGILSLTPDGRFLTTAGQGIIEYFEASESIKKPVKKIKYQADFTPSAVVFCAPSGSSAIVMRRGGEACWVNDERTLPITSNAGETLFFIQEQNQLLLVMKKKSALNFYNIPEFRKPVEYVFPKKIKPKTRGDVTFVRPLSSNKLLLLDNRGNLMTLSQSKRRWRKKLIITPQGL
jgi:WD40 repeat protein